MLLMQTVQQTGLNTVIQMASAWPFLVGLLSKTLGFGTIPKLKKCWKGEWHICIPSRSVFVHTVPFTWRTKNISDKMFLSWYSKLKIYEISVRYQIWENANKANSRNELRNVGEIKELKNIRKTSNCMVDRSVSVHTVSKPKWWCIAVFSFTFWWTKNMSSGEIPEFNKKKSSGQDEHTV